VGVAEPLSNYKCLTMPLGKRNLLDSSEIDSSGSIKCHPPTKFMFQTGGQESGHRRDYDAQERR